MTDMTDTRKSFYFHLGLIGILFILQFILPAYHHGNLARIMVLACYAMGYNILFGYTGLLSLGHAMFFAAGMYGMGLPMAHLGWTPEPALIAGLVAGVVVSASIGFLALRTSGVSFMIVTLMFAQAGFLTILYFGKWTRGDEGFVIQQAERVMAGFDLSQPTNRYNAALILFTICLLLTIRLVHSRFGRVMIAILENEERTHMLGYDVHFHKMDGSNHVRNNGGVIRGGLCVTFWLCRGDLCISAIFYFSPALGFAWWCWNSIRAIHRHIVYVLSD